MELAGPRGQRIGAPGKCRFRAERRFHFLRAAGRRPSSGGSDDDRPDRPGAGNHVGAPTNGDRRRRARNFARPIRAHQVHPGARTHARAGSWGAVAHAG